MSKPGHQDQFEGALRFALSADAVAAGLGISITTLGQLVQEGVIPKPFPVPGHPKLIRWDPEDVRNAVRDWKEKANLGTDGGWDSVR